MARIGDGRPARVTILRELANLIAGVQRQHPLRVAIDGTSAAGKTMLADELASLLAGRRPLIRASVDDFHNPREVRYRRGRLSPEGYYFDSFDYEALKAELLQPLGPGGNRCYRSGIRDVHNDEPLNRPQLSARSDAIVLVDGIFLMRPEIDEFWDLRLFVQVTEGAARERWLARDSAWMGEAEVIERYEKRYIPGERLYLDLARPEFAADIVLNNTDLAYPVAKVRGDFGGP